MEKKGFIFGFLAVVFLTSITKNDRLSAQNIFDNYITLSNGEFKDGRRVFEPLCINYSIDYDYCIDSMFCA